jgi:cytochrome c553
MERLPTDSGTSGPAPPAGPHRFPATRRNRRDRYRTAVPGKGRQADASRRRMVGTAALALLLQAGVLTTVFAAIGHASPAPATRDAFAAKLEYCQECHGAAGQGYHGFYPIPRLAGQQTRYFENQLHAFADRRRANDIMYNVARSLDPAMIAALAAHFRALDPPPLEGGARKVAAAGREIFQNGDPAANVAACAACHGPDARGTDEFPRLAGQLYPYIVKELTNFAAERGRNPANPDTSAIMKPVAHSLTRPQIEAVAAYLSSLN